MLAGSTSLIHKGGTLAKEPGPALILPGVTRLTALVSAAIQLPTLHEDWDGSMRCSDEPRPSASAGHGKALS